MPSSLTSDVRLRRVLADPYWIGPAVVAGLTAVVLGWGPVLAVLVVIAIFLVRVVTEYILPRGARLASADANGAQEAQIKASLRATLATARAAGLPAPALQRVESIQAVIEGILRRRSGHALPAHQLYAVLGTATDYLPGALQAYLRLPAAYAATRSVDHGRTALDVLTEQLALLEQEMTAVADAVTRNDLDRLLTHSRFLAARFPRPDLVLPGDQPPTQK